MGSFLSVRMCSRPKAHSHVADWGWKDYAHKTAFPNTSYTILILILHFSCSQVLLAILSFLSFINSQKEENVLTYPLLLSPTVEDRLAIFFSVFTIMLFQNTLIQRLFLTVTAGTMYTP